MSKKELGITESGITESGITESGITESSITESGITGKTGFGYNGDPAWPPDLARPCARPRGEIGKEDEALSRSMWSAPAPGPSASADRVISYKPNDGQRGGVAGCKRWRWYWCNSRNRCHRCKLSCFPRPCRRRPCCHSACCLKWRKGNHIGFGPWVADLPEADVARDVTATVSAAALPVASIWPWPWASDLHVIPDSCFPRYARFCYAWFCYTRFRYACFRYTRFLFARYTRFRYTWFRYTSFQLFVIPDSWIKFPCYTWFCYTNFCYTTFNILVIPDSVIPNSVMPDSISSLYPIPLYPILLYLFPLMRYTWFLNQISMLYMIPLYLFPL